MVPSTLRPLLSHIEASASVILSIIESPHLPNPPDISDSLRNLWANIRKSLQNLRYCSTRSIDLLKYEAENEADRQTLMLWFGKANQTAYAAEDVLIDIEFALDGCKICGSGSDEVGQKRKISEVGETNLYSAFNAEHLSNFSYRLNQVCLKFKFLLADHAQSFPFLRVTNQKVPQYQWSNVTEGQTVIGREVERLKLISLLLQNNSNYHSTDIALAPSVGMTGTDTAAHALSPPQDSNAHNVTLVCIVGDTGIGKSFLVHSVYNDCTVSEAFDLMLWVSMSRMTDESSLFKEMIECITHQPCDIFGSSVLQEILKEELSGKRFLLVLDDAENENEYFWSSFLAFLEIGGRESFVLVSTSSQSVASATGTKCLLYLDPLSMKNSWLMLSQFGFHPVVGFSLRKTCKQLIARCSGVPLCIKMSSWVLCCLYNEEFIEAVSLNKLWENNEMGGSILPALRVFYDILPTNLKNCLKYCSLFPKNFIFEKDHAIHLWISQGFIDPTEGTELEEIGIRYFDELLDRSFFKKFPFHNAKEDKFVMHEHIYHLVQHVSREEHFLYDNCLNSAPANVKHFIIAPDELKTKEISMLTNDDGDLQTFYVVNRSTAQWNSTFSPIVHLIPLHLLLMKFKNLKTLNLSGTDIEELPESIQILENLCYLGLNGTKIKILPVEIVKLVNLLTLEAKYCRHLVELPKDVTELSNLRHLDVRKKSGFVGMPCGIGRLTNLHTLSILYVGDGISHCSIGEMKNLNNVRGSLQIAGLENIESGDHAKEANLTAKIFVQGLVLEWNGDRQHIKCDSVAFEVLECLIPSNHLQELIIRNYPGIQFPMWVEDSKFSNLTSVVVDNCFKTVRFPSLGMLPSLRYLSVRKMYGLKKMGRTKRSGWKMLPSFPSLELLNLQEMHGLEELFEIEDGDFPCLQTLSISRCLMLKNIPCFPSLMQLAIHSSNCIPEISCLPSLKLLKIEGFYKARLLCLPRNLPQLKKLEINHCNELVSVEGLPWLTSIRNFKVNRCPKLRIDNIWKMQKIEKNTTRDPNEVQEIKVDKELLFPIGSPNNAEVYPRTSQMAENPDSSTMTTLSLRTITSTSKGSSEVSEILQQQKKCVYPGCSMSARCFNLCIAHGGGRRFNKAGCTKGAEGKTMSCKVHSGGRRCKQLGCMKSANGHTDFCIAHAGGKRCVHPECTRVARGLSNLCIRHGGAKICKLEGCTKRSEGSTSFCIAHGGGRRCVVPDCTKGARGHTNLCLRHGGGKRCKVEGCSKGSQGKDFCKAHGGGRKCIHLGCTNFARGKINFCTAHGGRERCKFEGCGESTGGSTEFCKAHAGQKHYNILGNKISSCGSSTVYESPGNYQNYQFEGPVMDSPDKEPKGKGSTDLSD